MSTQKIFSSKVSKDKIIMTLVVLFVFIFPIFFGNPFEIDLKDESSHNKQEELVRVTHVIDGDTFVVNTGQKVRLLGIDTPEKNQPYYEEAKQYLEELVQGKEVRLEKDISEIDKYNRILRHVHMDGIWVNKRLIEEGLARLLTLPPDVKYVEELKQAQEQARQQGKGIWSNL